MEKCIRVYLVDDKHAGIPERMMHLLPLPSPDYVLTYEYKIRNSESREDISILNDVFATFNGGINLICGISVMSTKRKHSLSINDVVAIDDTFYKCITTGWLNIIKEGINITI